MTAVAFMIARPVRGDAQPGSTQRTIVAWRPVDHYGRHATSLGAKREWFSAWHPEVTNVTDEMVRNAWNAMRRNEKHYALVKVKPAGEENAPKTR